MKQFIAPQITRDHLLSVEVGEEVSFIMPCERKMRDDFLYEEYIAKFIGTYSPLQPQDEFFIAEEFAFYDTIDKVYYRDSKFVHGNEDWQEAQQITPEQSRFHGVVVDVRVEQLADDYVFHVIVKRLK